MSRSGSGASGGMGVAVGKGVAVGTGVAVGGGVGGGVGVGVGVGGGAGVGGGVAVGSGMRVAVGSARGVNVLRRASVGIGSGVLGVPEAQAVKTRTNAITVKIALTGFIFKIPTRTNITTLKKQFSP